MTAKRYAAGEFAFGPEGMVGTAAAAALRRVRSLLERAPSGRMFQAIATLTDMSKRSEHYLEQGAEALRSGHQNQAELDLARARTQLEELADEAGNTSPVPIPLPDYKHRKR
jgi:hypothetical protein